LHRARALLKHQFRLEVEKELTEKETEPWEIIYFKHRASGRGLRRIARGCCVGRAHLVMKAYLAAWLLH
jgi:hypothetical protein